MRPAPTLPPAPLPVARQARQARQASTRRPARPGERRAAPWWVLVEGGAIALVLAVTGGFLVASNVVVDWREPVGAAVLLLTPFLVWYVASHVRHRWLALAAAYVAVVVVGAGIAVGGALVLTPTVAGFAGAALGPLAGAAAFVLTSRRPGRAERPPVAVGPGRGQPDPTGDTDTMPYVLPKDELRRMRDGDSLAG